VSFGISLETGSETDEKRVVFVVAQDPCPRCGGKEKDTPEKGERQLFLGEDAGFFSLLNENPETEIRNCFSNWDSASEDAWPASSTIARFVDFYEPEPRSPRSNSPLHNPNTRPTVRNIFLMRTWGNQFSGLRGCM
jgi:hypothetical protein